MQAYLLGFGDLLRKIPVSLKFLIGFVVNFIRFLPIIPRHLVQADTNVS